MRRVLPWALGGACVAALVAGLVYFPAAPPAPSPVASPVIIAPSMGAAPASTARPCAFTVGQRLSFALESSVAVSLSDELSRYVAGSDLSPSATSSAVLSFEVLAVEPARALLLGRLTSATDAVQRSGGEGVDSAWLTRVNERCEVEGFARHHATTRKAGRQQQALLSELWFSVPPQHAPVVVRFENATGQALGYITPASASEPDTLVRTLSRFESAWAPSMNGVTVLTSRTLVHRGAAPWFEAISGEEEYSVPGSITRARATLTVTSAAVDEAALAGASRDEGDYVWESCFSAVPDQALRPWVPADHAQRVAAMKDVAYADALERMLTTFETTSNLHEQARDMSAFLDAHPEQIHEYAGALLTEFEPEWKAAGFLALAQTQHAAAREVLLDVWRERQASSADRIRASLGLVTRRDVGLPLARELVAEAGREGSDDERMVAQQALLHVGVLAGLRPEDEALRGEVRRALAGQLSLKHTPLEAGTVFAAIGNTGDLSLLSQVEQASRDPDPKWRAAAPIALRRMPIADVRAFTLEWIRRETSPDVLQELFEVVQHQYQDVGQTIDAELAKEAVRVLRKQPRILTRQSIVQLLQPWVALDDDVRAAFREVLKLEYETNSGMFAFVASCLPEEDVQRVLATIPSLADQSRPVIPSSRPATPPPEPTTAPPEMLPTLTPEAP